MELYGDVYPQGGCPDKLKDQKGKCPGEGGHTPQVLLVPEKYKNFAAFTAAKKAEKEAAEKAKNN